MRLTILRDEAKKITVTAEVHGQHVNNLMVALGVFKDGPVGKEGPELVSLGVGAHLGPFTNIKTATEQAEAVGKWMGETLGLLRS